MVSCSENYNIYICIICLHIFSHIYVNVYWRVNLKCLIGTMWGPLVLLVKKP
jgi:hypothetical protein